MRFLWVSLIISMLFSTCQKNTEDKGEVVASVYEKKLYKADLENIVYDGINYKDSVMRAKVYIDKWVRNQLLVRQAENNLEPSQIDFSKRLEEYRNSLVINEYETELIRQNLDTEVTEDEIYEYYENNSGEFRLNRDIVKVAAVTLPNDCKKKWLFVKLLRDYDTIMVDSISSLSDQYAETYNMDVDKWHNFDDIIDIYGLEVNNNKSFLNENRYFTVRGKENTTYVRICDYKVIGDESPCEIEMDRIKYIILSNRKKNLLEKLYDDLYSKAVRDKSFEVY